MTGENRGLFNSQKEFRVTARPCAEHMKTTQPKKDLKYKVI